MELISTSDVIFLKAALAGSVFFGIQHYLPWPRKQPTEPLIPRNDNSLKHKSSQILPPTRSINKRLSQTGKQCLIFYGSQTGTAEKLALRFLKEAKTRFGLDSMVADLDDYDYEDLGLLPSNTVIVFLLATYGEGEPTDNAIVFDQYCKKTLVPGSLSTLHYAAFGLGSSSYQHYNMMIKRVDSGLANAGAIRIGDVGFGDDGKRTLEDDFLVWKNITLPLVAAHLGFCEKPYRFEASFLIDEANAPANGETFLGEPNKAHLKSKVRGPYTVANPYPAKIIASRELFSAGDRNCMHVEFDIGNSSLRYETGDHLAIRPMNSDLEVERFLRVFGLLEKKNYEINVSSQDPTIKVPIPTKTTYETVARYYLDICAPVSRHFLGILAFFAPDEASKAKVARLGADHIIFQREVTSRYLNISQSLERLGTTEKWSCVPFSLLLENLGKFQPRFYSISSSSLVSKNVISITAVVEKQRHVDWQDEFKGVSTNYLLALTAKTTASEIGSEANLALQPLRLTHQVAGPRSLYPQPTAFISVRSSKLRLPKNVSTPIIMIGPGTGVAPFRGFVHERAMRSQSSKTIGRTMLFYGCRRTDEDFVYKEEWSEIAKSFPSSIFSMHVAFSRETKEKVYVQDLLQEKALELRSLLLHQDAHVYVCGDAHRMARDVFQKMTEIVADSHEFCGNMQHAREHLKSLKESGRWAEDVW